MIIFAIALVCAPFGLLTFGIWLLTISLRARSRYKRRIVPVAPVIDWQHAQVYARREARRIAAVAQQAWEREIIDGLPRNAPTALD